MSTGSIEGQNVHYCLHAQFSILVWCDLVLDDTKSNKAEQVQYNVYVMVRASVIGVPRHQQFDWTLQLSM